MELLNLIVNHSDANTNCCFLCSKQSKTNVKLEEIFEVNDESPHTTKPSISKVEKVLILSRDYMSSEVCKECCKLMIKINSVMKRNNLSKQLLYSIIDCIDNEQFIIQEYNKTCKIKISLPTEIKYDIEENDPVAGIEENTEEYSIQCTKCCMKFDHQTSLMKHTKVSHRLMNKSLVCDVCGKFCPTSTSLKSHLNCHREKPCPHCDKILKTHTHYQIHVKQHEKKIARKRYKTTYCCDHCNYQSCNKMTLEAHINKIHLNLKPFCCDICDKAFYKKSHLVEHKSIHCFNKHHTCDKCGDSFANKRCLDEHLRLHLGNKKYKCDKCDVRFITLSRRNEHIKRKHMEKLEICNVCGKQYGLKKELNRHHRLVHQNTINDNIFTQL